MRRVRVGGALKPAARDGQCSVVAALVLREEVAEADHGGRVALVGGSGQPALSRLLGGLASLLCSPDGGRAGVWAAGALRFPVALVGRVGRARPARVSPRAMFPPNRAPMRPLGRQRTRSVLRISPSTFLRLAAASSTGSGSSLPSSGPPAPSTRAGSASSSFSLESWRAKWEPSRNWASTSPASAAASRSTTLRRPPSAALSPRSRSPLAASLARSTRCAARPAARRSWIAVEVSSASGCRALATTSRRYSGLGPEAVARHRARHSVPLPRSAERRTRSSMRAG